MNYQLLLEQISEYARHYYRKHDTDKLIYHNQDHTEYVVSKSTLIANHYQLNDRDFFIVAAAAWFHDLGYMVSPARHEEHSAAIAEEFLQKHEVSADDIAAIKKTILATCMPQQPETLLDKIICDADLFHLGTDDFDKKDKQLRKELKVLCGVDLSKLEWHRKTLKFLEMHHYHTDYCQLLLNVPKQKNMERIEKKIDKAKEKGDEEEDESIPAGPAATDVKENAIAQPHSGPTPDGSDKSLKKGKKDRPDKGIETMFRISSGNHQRLSDMADNKAHIMITVNSIILSAIISLLLRRLNEYPYFLIPTCILLGISLLAMTFAILSTRPSIPPGTFTRADVDDRNVNLLFFGNFYKMSLADYNYGMEKMMEDRQFLYGSLIKDVYAQGVVLGKKYRLLRASYNIFMFGLIAAVLAFIVAAAFFNQDVVLVK